MTSVMSEREKVVAEIKRVKAALNKTKSEKLIRDYTKHLHRLQKQLLEGV